MLQARLARALGAGAACIVVASLIAGCGDGSGPIADNVVRPGITAIEQASALACSSDAATLQTAIEVYTELEGKPPADEAALVAAQYLREESKYYDVVDGQIVPVDPGCGSTGAVATTPSGSAPMTAPATDLGEIVTGTDPPLTAEQMLAEFTPEEIAEVGGQECAGELASIFVAAQNYIAEHGEDPESIDGLAGYLDQPIDLWMLEDDSLVPASGSPCVAFDDATASNVADMCHSDALTLTVAREAYLAQYGSSVDPTEQQLVDVEFIRQLSTNVDLVGGAVVAVPGGPCDGVDLGL